MAKIENQKRIELHLEKGDYFGTLATILDLIRQEIESQQRRGRIARLLDKLKDDLLGSSRRNQKSAQLIPLSLSYIENMSRPSHPERDNLIYDLHQKGKSFSQLSKIFKLDKRAAWEAYWKVAAKKGKKVPKSAR